MKKICLLALVACACVSAFAQNNQNNAPGGTGTSLACKQPTTVSLLSSTCGTTKGTLATVTDGTSATDCTTGGGSTVAVCQYTGSAWTATSSSGGPPLGSPAQFPIMNSGGTAYAPQSITGDASATTAGVWTNTGLQGVAVPNPAAQSGYFADNAGVWQFAGTTPAISTQTSGLTVTSSQSGTFFRMNCPANCTVTLPSTAPTGLPWGIVIQNPTPNLTVSVNPNGLNLTEGTTVYTTANPLTLSTLQQVYIGSDGSNYFTSAATGQALAPSSVNLIPAIDGLTNINPQTIYASATYGWGTNTTGFAGNQGGSLYWPNSAGATITLGATVGSSQNAYSNNQTTSAPTLAFGGSCSGNTVAASGVFSVTLVGLDRLGNTWPLAQIVNQSTGSGGCPQLTAPAGLTNVAGLFNFEYVGCNTTNCTPNVYLATNGSFSSTSNYQFAAGVTAQKTLGWVGASGPIIPPYNTTGMVTQSSLIGLGPGSWQINIPQMVGTYSAIGGLKRNVTMLQLSTGFPNSIPTLELPFGALNTSAPDSGTAGQAVSMVWGLFDSGSGSSTLVSTSEQYTFPKFLAEGGTNYLNLSVYHPGVPQIFACPGNGYCNSTYYWLGERIATTQGAVGVIEVVTAQGTTGASGKPTFSTSINGTVTDGATWKTIGSFAAYAASGSYTLGSNTTGEIFCSNTGTFWEVEATGTAGSTTNPCTSVPASAPTGTEVCDGTPSGATCTGGLWWINLGPNTLVSPLFAPYAVTCASTSATKSCVGSGGTYLSALKEVTGSSFTGTYNQGSGSNSTTYTYPSAAWNGWSANATIPVCSGCTFTTRGVSIDATGTGGSITASPSMSGVTCSTVFTGATCGTAASPTLLQITQGTPSGVAGPASEINFTPSAGQALQFTLPTTIDDNTVGFSVYSAVGTASSANALHQPFDGINAICSTYVTNLPYGTLCAPGSTVTLTNIQVGNNRMPQTNMSEAVVFLAGSPLTDNWPGGAYGVTVNNLSINCPKGTFPFEAQAWGIVNMAAQEGSNQNGSTGGNGININGCSAGGEYAFSSGAQDTGFGTMHINGTVDTRTTPVRIEDIPGLVSDMSIGFPQGSQYDGRAGVLFVVPPFSTLGTNDCGELNRSHYEDVTESVLVINCSARIATMIGDGSAGRSPVNGIHFAPFAPGGDVNDILSGATSNTNTGNVLIDDVDPVFPYTNGSSHQVVTAVTFGDMTNATCGSLATNFSTDATRPTQLCPGLTWGTATTNQGVLSSTGSSAVIQPKTDATTALVIKNAAGTSTVGSFDTSNLRFRVGDNVAPTQTFDVKGLFTITGSVGEISKYANIATAGAGIPFLVAATSQAARTGSAANIMSYSPGATVGTYRVCVTANVSAVSSSTIAWVLSWKDSNGTTQTTIQEPFSQQGTLAPAFSFTTTGNYTGCTTIDTDNSNTSIVAAWVGGGTTTAKVSGTIERFQ